AQDDNTTQDLALALDPAFTHLDAKDTARKSIDTAGDAPLPAGDATALVTPDVDARAAIAALRAPSGDAATRGANAMTGMLLPGQNASDTSTRLTQPGGLRDLKPNLS